MKIQNGYSNKLINIVNFNYTKNTYVRVAQNFHTKLITIF